MSWRWISNDGASAARGLAADEVLAHRVGTAASPPTLRLYSYRPHVALVGRFQDAEHELHLDYCRAAGVEVNRRPTGGGTILMGPDQLGVALALNARREDRVAGLRGRARELMARFSTGVVGGLERLGIDASFRGKNDVEAGGRKLAGLGIWRDSSGGLLFHASLLIDLDVALMARVLRLPFELGEGREVATLERRMSTVRGLLGQRVTLDDVRLEIARGFGQAFGVELEQGRLDPAEERAIDALEHEKYRTDAWVFQRTDVPDATGAAVASTPGGRLDVRIALAGRMIKAAHVRGTFFEDEAALADLEGWLRWHSAEPDAVARTVRSWAERYSVGTVPAGTMAEAFAAAVTDALAGRESAPYGCFVSPRGQGAAIG